MLNSIKKIVGFLSTINTVVGTFIVLIEFWGNFPTLINLVGGIAYYIGKLEILSFVGFFIIFTGLTILGFLSGKVIFETNHFRTPNWVLIVSATGGFVVGLWQAHGIPRYSRYYSDSINIFGVITLNVDAGFIKLLGTVTLLIGCYCIYFLYSTTSNMD